MEFDERRQEARETRFAASAVLGMIALAAGAALSGPLASALCFAAGGTLVGYAAYTAFCPDKGDACTPQPCWPEDATIETPAGPLPAIGVRIDSPPSEGRWIERTARTETARRGR